RLLCALGRGARGTAHSEGRGGRQRGFGTGRGMGTRSACDAARQADPARKRSVAVALAEPAVGQPKGSAGSYGRHAWRIRGIARLQEKRSMQALPTYDDVVAAAQRIEGHAHRTPVMRSGTLARET